MGEDLPGIRWYMMPDQQRALPSEVLKKNALCIAIALQCWQAQQGRYKADAGLVRASDLEDLLSKLGECNIRISHVVAGRKSLRATCPGISVEERGKILNESHKRRGE